MAMMNLTNNNFVANTLQANVANRKVDLRLSLSLKREFWISKFNAVLPAMKRRCFHAYCIGTPRSGTHSIAHMFAHHYGASHEPHAYYAIYHLLKWATNKYTDADIRNILKWRDKKMSLDLEAAHYLHHVADVLVKSFPQAKFIFTIRDPLSWLESEINRNYGTRHKLFWRELEDYRYGRYRHQFTPHDSALKQVGLYPIKSYLSYWKDHNQSVLNSIPQERLLTLETREIRSSIQEISNFLDINVDTINTRKGHSDRRKKKLKLADLVEKRYLCQQLDSICSDLIESQFPTLKRDWHSIIE